MTLWTVLAVLLMGVALAVPVASAGSAGPAHGPAGTGSAPVADGAGTWSTQNATGNLTAALGRMVFVAGLGAGAVVTLVWCRVALSWFSHDPSRKVQAKERARDALVGSLILLAAVSGLAWGLAQFVLTGA